MNDDTRLTPNASPSPDPAPSPAPRKSMFTRRLERWEKERAEREAKAAVKKRKPRSSHTRNQDPITGQFLPGEAVGDVNVGD